LDRVEGNGHSHKEECSVSVLNTLNGTVTILEQNDCENGSNDSNDQLNIGCLWETKCVEEISFEKEAQLIEPRSVAFLCVLISDGLDSWVHILVIVLQSRLLVAGAEVLNSLCVVFNNLGLSPLVRFVLLVSYFLTLDTHDTHEVIGGVA
jgi:hypothetical protein